MNLNGRVARQSWTEDGVFHRIGFVYDQQGKPLTLRYQAGDAYYTYYCLTNLQGDVIKLYLVDLVNGKLVTTEVASYTYDAWGNVTDITRTAADTQDIAHLNPIRYRGYYQDVETGFYYLESRYYDPAIGRFINADNFASTGTGFLGFNMFAYCNNNPVCNCDSTGHFFEAVGAFISNLLSNIGRAISSVAPSYAAFGGIAIADGPLPFGDAVAVVSAGLLTVGAIGCGIYQSIRTSASSISRAKEKEKDIAISSQPKKQAYFTINPYDFKPIGLIREEYPGSYNGRIIQWKDPISNAIIFEWNEDFKYGSHYHALTIQWAGVHDGTHYLPGTPVPEPLNSIYFGG